MQGSTSPSFSKPYSHEGSYINFDNVFVKASIMIGRIGPRTIIGLAAGFYCVGYLYANGWMALADKATMYVMRDYLNMSYIAIGALAPTIQWYTQHTIRIGVGIAAALAYDLMERVVILSFSYFAPDTSGHKPNHVPTNGVQVFPVSVPT